MKMGILYLSGLLGIILFPFLEAKVDDHYLSEYFFTDTGQDTHGGNDNPAHSGSQGPQGRPGMPGPKGDRGVPGAPGSPGPEGRVGPRGFPGTQGRPGPQGLKGEQGIKGDKGDPGSEGHRGKQGPIGPPGSPGSSGSPGSIGSPGQRGPHGTPGSPGKDGLPGKPGKDGKNGRDGSPGHNGRSGQPGPQGDVGPKGEQGINGQPGAVGESGPVGPKGEPGRNGKDGENGMSVSVKELKHLIFDILKSCRYKTVGICSREQSPQEKGLKCAQDCKAKYDYYFKDSECVKIGESDKHGSASSESCRCEICDPTHRLPDRLDPHVKYMSPPRDSQDHEDNKRKCIEKFDGFCFGDNPEQQNNDCEMVCTKKHGRSVFGAVCQPDKIKPGIKRFHCICRICRSNDNLPKSTTTSVTEFSTKQIGTETSGISLGTFSDTEIVVTTTAAAIDVNTTTDSKTVHLITEIKTSLGSMTAMTAKQGTDGTTKKVQNGETSATTLLLTTNIKDKKTTTNNQNAVTSVGNAISTTTDPDVKESTINNENLGTATESVITTDANPDTKETTTNNQNPGLSLTDAIITTVNDHSKTVATVIPLDTSATIFSLTPGFNDDSTTETLHNTPINGNEETVSVSTQLAGTTKQQEDTTHTTSSDAHGTKSSATTGNAHEEIVATAADEASTNEGQTMTPMSSTEITKTGDEQSFDQQNLMKFQNELPAQSSSNGESLKQQDKEIDVADPRVVDLKLDASSESYHLDSKKNLVPKTSVNDNQAKDWNIVIPDPGKEDAGSNSNVVVSLDNGNDMDGEGVVDLHLKVNMKHY